MHHLGVGHVKFFGLIFFRIEGVNHVDTCQIFSCHTVLRVGQLLNLTETRQANHHNRKNGRTDHDHRTCGDSRQLPALAEYLDDRPDRHDRCFYKRL